MQNAAAEFWEDAPQPALKKYSDWRGNLSQFLRIGDVVDQEFVDYFLNVLPPVCWSNFIIQMGEPYSHDEEGYPTYATLKNTLNGWVYAGHCRRGETIERS